MSVCVQHRCRLSPSKSFPRLVELADTDLRTRRATVCLQNDGPRKKEGFPICSCCFPRHERKRCRKKVTFMPPGLELKLLNSLKKNAFTQKFGKWEERQEQQVGVGHALLPRALLRLLYPLRYPAGKPLAAPSEWLLRSPYQSQYLEVLWALEYNRPSQTCPSQKRLMPGPQHSHLLLPGIGFSK